MLIGKCRPDFMPGEEKSILFYTAAGRA